MQLKNLSVSSPYNNDGMAKIDERTKPMQQQHQSHHHHPQSVWYQHDIDVLTPGRGCHPIMYDILEAAESDISKIHIGMCNLFVQHTTASLTISERDRNLAKDMETAMTRIVPESWSQDGTFTHVNEGIDDMPGHVKSSLMGFSLNIPIKNGQLVLKSWQCIYLHEHRESGGWGEGNSRSVIITLQGQSR
jgi:secondary thiamine-phosphate synthase enzyme